MINKFIEDFEAHIKAENINVYRMAVVRRGEEPIVREYKVCNPCQNSYSVTKAFTLTAIGMLYDEGRIDMQAKVSDILREFCDETTDPHWNEVTVEQVIWHHTGLPSAYLDIDCNSVYDYGEDFLAACLRYPILPTETRVYADANFYILARIFEAIEGMPVDEFLWKRIFFKMRFSEAGFSKCPQGHPLGSTGLYIRTEDMLKLGELYLCGGVWRGERILSEEWVRMVRERGYLPPINGTTAYGHAGMRGQMLMIIPDSDCAVAWHGYHSSDLRGWVCDYFMNINNKEI